MCLHVQHCKCYKMDPKTGDILVCKSWDDVINMTFGCPSNELDIVRNRHSKTKVPNTFHLHASRSHRKICHLQRATNTKSVAQNKAEDVKKFEVMDHQRAAKEGNEAQKKNGRR